MYICMFSVFVYVMYDLYCYSLLMKFWAILSLQIYLFILFMYLLFYVAFNSQGHIAMGSLQVEETSKQPGIDK